MAAAEAARQREASETARAEALEAARRADAELAALAEAARIAQQALVERARAQAEFERQRLDALNKALVAGIDTAPALEDQPAPKRRRSRLRALAAGIAAVSIPVVALQLGMMGWWAPPEVVGTARAAGRIQPAQAGDSTAPLMPDDGGPTVALKLSPALESAPEGVR